MIVVYTKHNCPKCDMTKKVLMREGIEYTVRNVEEDGDALHYVKNVLGLSSLPVTIIEGHAPIVGFAPEKLRKLKTS